LKKRDKLRDGNK